MFYRAHKRVQKNFTKPSLTKQSFEQESDINRIIAKYRKTGVIEWLNKNEPRSGDFSSAPSFMDAQVVVARGQAMFDDLPANIRKRFENDPAQFLAFMHNPDNKDELIRMGLARKPAPPPPETPASPPATTLAGTPQEPSGGSK